MPSSFKPPGIDRLTDVDQADCEYHAECVEIQGVVSPASQGGWPATTDYKVHCFSFSAWRHVGQPLVKQKLTILRPIAPDADLSGFPACSIHRINVLLSKDETRAVFVSLSTLNEVDHELSAIAEELQKPVVISTSRFGDLTLDRHVGWFEGEVEWNGGPIRITFETADNATIGPGLQTAEALWDHQAEWKRKVDDFAVQKLLPLKNDVWLDDDEQPLTADQFQARMTLESISIYDDGQFEFWHDDGDLFFGHSIHIVGSLKDGLIDADTPG